ncbi:hypothetical protein FQR65_LT15415 [Abscondita terminalis]|nr:hypothetical protein FQR65_LT15415 [Abscondita terminalis]
MEISCRSLFFSILFGLGLTKLGGTGTSPLAAELQTVFKSTLQYYEDDYEVSSLRCIRGMAYTIGTHTEIEALAPYGSAYAFVYATMILFIFVCLNIICRRNPDRNWGPSSSESVVTQYYAKDGNFGCFRSVVGLVFHVDLSFAQLLTIIGILLVTSKGAAAVTGGGFIVLAGTLTALKVIPVEGMAILLGVDRFMSEARAITNLIGNGVATVVIAKSEKEFDEENIHELKEGYNTLEEFNNFVEGLGIKLNTSGGKIKTSEDGLLRQSSTVSALYDAKFSDGVTLQIAGSYVEFAERSVLPEFKDTPRDQITAAQRRDGFETNNAIKF